ncbi:hypothetical protein [Cryptosporangium minutisporangium]|uniref:Uncharacterized protein n=1 Tax=Cryptosporangium minutisporangium TaxID=113569 RepID=A0ABP6TD39_9ACTN
MAITGVVGENSGRVVRLALLGPLTAVLLFAVGLVVLASLPLPEPLQYPVLTLLGVGGAAVLARLGRWWTLPDAGLSALVFCVTAPPLLLGVAQYALLHSSSKLTTHGPAYLVFFGGLAGLLVAVDRLVAAGRRARAWSVGVLGAVVLADLAVIVTVVLSGADAPHPASAPVWLFTALTDSGFGLPSPSGWETFTITDAVELDPLLYLLSGGLALGAVTARRAR